MFIFNRRYLQEVADEGSADVAASTEDTQESLLDSASPELNEGEWFIMDGVKGTGEKPEFFNDGKYKTLAEQAKAQRELEKKFGAFTGAPKDGYELPEGFDKEDALVQEVLKFGEETNMSQEGFGKLLELAMTQAEVTQQVSVENELKKLGDNATQRIKTVETFLKSKLDSDTYTEIQDLVNTAESVQLVETMIKALAPAKLPIDGGEHPAGLTWDDIEKEMLKKDEHGNFLRSIDANHEAKVQRMMKEWGGDKQHHIVMSG